MNGLLEMTEKETEQLVWIHSNKFITVDLFYKKFLPQQSSRNAYYILNKYVDSEKGFLYHQKTSVNTSSFFFLSPKALWTLDEQNRILVKNHYPVRVNTKEREHDMRVQEIRIILEACEDLKDIFWVSDFEMRSGINPSIKAAFVKGELDKEKWRSNGLNPNPIGRRTPDGYFEADFEGERVGFTLEFENGPYNDRMLCRMTDNLKDFFPYATKLVVSANPKNAVRMIGMLQAKIRSEDRHLWYISDLDKVKTLPFKRCWHQLNHPIGG